MVQATTVSGLSYCNRAVPTQGILLGGSQTWGLCPYLTSHLPRRIWASLPAERHKRPPPPPRGLGAVLVALRKEKSSGVSLAQLVEQAALDLRDVSSSPMLGLELTLKQNLYKKKTRTPELSYPLPLLPGEAQVWVKRRTGAGPSLTRLRAPARCGARRVQVSAPRAAPSCSRPQVQGSSQAQAARPWVTITVSRVAW